MKRKQGIVVASSDLQVPVSDSFPNVRVNSIYTTAKTKSTYKQGHKAYKHYGKTGLRYSWCHNKPAPIPYNLEAGSITKKTKLTTNEQGITVCPKRKLR